MNNFKRTENWLKNYRPMKKRIRVLDKIISMQEKSLVCDDGMTGISYDGITTSKTYKINSMVESIVINSVSKLDMLRAERETYIDLVEITDLALEGLTTELRKLLYLKYLSEEPLTWVQVSRVLHKSEDHVRGALRKQAIVEVSKVIWGLEKRED